MNDATYSNEFLDERFSLDQKISSIASNTQTDPEIAHLWSNADPTENKKYLKWIVLQAKRKLIHWPSDEKTIRELLKQAIERRIDVGRFSVSQLTSEITGKSSHDYEIVYKDPRWKVIKIISPETCSRLSVGPWCTRDIEKAKQYIDDGPIFLVYFRGKKYALVHEKTRSLKGTDNRRLVIDPDRASELYGILRKSGITTFEDNEDVDPWHNDLKSLKQAYDLHGSKVETKYKQLLEKHKNEPWSVVKLTEYDDLARIFASSTAYDYQMPVLFDEGSVYIILHYGKRFGIAEAFSGVHLLNGKELNVDEQTLALIRNALEKSGWSGSFYESFREAVSHVSFDHM